VLASGSTFIPLYLSQLTAGTAPEVTVPGFPFRVARCILHLPSALQAEWSTVRSLHSSDIDTGAFPHCPGERQWMMSKSIAIFNRSRHSIMKGR
jgi:hypothetical protein